NGAPATGCESTATSFTTGAVPAAPANDEPCAAVTIGATPTQGTTVSSTQNIPPALCSSATSTSANDVWYQFTATANGAAVVTLDNTGFADLVVQAFSGTCSSLTSLGCIDATTGDEVLPLTGLVAGQTYFVRVYGYDGEQGIFELSVTGAALPITIEYFRGTKQNGKNVLDWKVSCYNSPTVNLTIERSADGRNFTAIRSTTETAARCLQPFNYDDVAPLSGINYYRLKSVDADGKIAYSNLVALLNKEKGFEIVALSPNPVKDLAILNVTSAQSTIMEIVVTDLNGKQLSKQRVSLIAGNNQLPLSLGKLPAGTYQVTGLTADGQAKSTRFVKQ
ncbi:MAG: T9SS type A sorting domain-containing protein, partial [Chitinophagaceae bacterium]